MATKNGTDKTPEMMPENAEMEVHEQTSAEKMVRIRLFKDNRAYRGDVFVGVNGRTFQIQRGVEVEVPECVAEVLKNSEKQDAEAVRLMTELGKGSDW